MDTPEETNNYNIDQHGAHMGYQHTLVSMLFSLEKFYYSVLINVGIITHSVLSKSTRGEQLVEDIPNFTCIMCVFMYGFVSRLLAKRKTIQT